MGNNQPPRVVEEEVIVRVPVYLPAPVQPPPPPNPELEKPWRKFDWGQKKVLEEKLKEFSVSHPEVKVIRILVAGQVGAGKSSFINSINNAFHGRITSGAPVDSCSGRSFTKSLKSHRIKTSNSVLPFVFTDIMGLEPEQLAGSQPDDIVNAIFGHMKDGYKFDEDSPLSWENPEFNKEPSLSELAFCLVYVVAADTVDLTDDHLIEKLRTIRMRISQKRIPQVLVMTKVDEACPLVNKDLKKVYYSKKIKEKMQMCSSKLGVPINNIFPVKNYHDEIDTDDDVDVLILKALDQIVHLANDRLMEDT